MASLTTERGEFHLTNQQHHILDYVVHLRCPETFEEIQQGIRIHSTSTLLHLRYLVRCGLIKKIKRNVLRSQRKITFYWPAISVEEFEQFKTATVLDELVGVQPPKKKIAVHLGKIQKGRIRYQHAKERRIAAER